MQLFRPSVDVQCVVFRLLNLFSRVRNTVRIRNKTQYFFYANDYHFLYTTTPVVNRDVGWKLNAFLHLFHFMCMYYMCVDSQLSATITRIISLLSKNAFNYMNIHSQKNNTSYYGKFRNVNIHIRMPFRIWGFACDETMVFEW